MMGFINLFLVLFFFTFSFFAIPSGDAMNVTDTGGNPLLSNVLYYIKSDLFGYVTVNYDNPRLSFESNNSQSVTNTKFMFSTVSDKNYIQIKTETGIEVFANIVSDNRKLWYLMAGEKPENVPKHEFAIKKHHDDATWSLFVIFNSKAHPVFSGGDGLYTNSWSVGFKEGIGLKFDLVYFYYSSLPSGGATEVTDTGGIPLQPTALYYIKSDLYGYVNVDSQNFLLFGNNNSQSPTNTKFKFSAVGDGNFIQIKTETGKEVFAWILPGSTDPWYLMAGKKPENVSHKFGMEKYDDDGTWSLFVIFNSKAHAVFARDKGLYLYANEWSVGSKGIAFKYERVQ